MDYTVADALEAGFDGVVLIVREEVRSEILAHARHRWPPELELVSVLQGPVAGTAQAVASAREVVSGSFAVVNADDLYGAAALSLLAREVERLEPRVHGLVGYRLADTILTEAPVTRGVCETHLSGELARIAEQKVERRTGGFLGYPIGSGPEAGSSLSGEETVSMNLWAFDESIFDDLDEALGSFEPESVAQEAGKPPELLLPSVVGDLVSSGRAQVRVSRADGRCIGITHPDDLPLVRELLSATDGA